MHILSSSRYKKFEFWTLVDAVTHTHLFLSEGNFKHEPPEGASAAFSVISAARASHDASSVMEVCSPMSSIINPYFMA